MEGSGSYLTQQSLPAKYYPNESQETGAHEINIFLFALSPLMELAVLFKADLSNVSALQVSGLPFFQFSTVVILTGEFF